MKVDPKGDREQLREILRENKGWWREVAFRLDVSEQWVRDFVQTDGRIPSYDKIVFLAAILDEKLED